MAEIYALPLSGISNSDIEFRNELDKKHKMREFLSYDMALNQLKLHGTSINQKWKIDAMKKIRPIYMSLGRVMLERCCISMVIMSL